MPSPTGALIALVGVAGWGLLGCAAGVPLLHPAHVLRPGGVAVGAGLSGELSLGDVHVRAGSDPRGANRLAQLTAASGVAPWGAGRFGIIGENEAGLTYTGRTLRLDVRHAFALGEAALSVGVGGSLITAERPGADLAGSRVFGGGVDIPVLLGAHSRNQVYALWGGPRVGFEALGGRIAMSAAPMDAPTLSDFSARHFFGGFVVGVRGGFRHVHVALELDGAYHRADGSVFAAKAGVSTFALAPSGALLMSF